jgi:hypothetical protein
VAWINIVSLLRRSNPNRPLRGLFHGYILKPNILNQTRQVPVRPKFAWLVELQINALDTAVEIAVAKCDIPDSGTSYRSNDKAETGCVDAFKCHVAAVVVKFAVGDEEEGGEEEADCENEDEEGDEEDSDDVV